jgi:Tfp pilus assembly protein PilO
LTNDEKGVGIGQVTHLRSMEKETAKLNRELQTYKNQHANLEVLKEAKKSLENKLRGMDELRTRSAGLEVDLQEMKREREEWYV